MPMDVQARWVNSVTSKLAIFNGLREKLKFHGQAFPGVKEDTPEFSIYLQVKQSYLQLKEFIEQRSTSHETKGPTLPNNTSIHNVPITESGAAVRPQRKRAIPLDEVISVDEASVMMCKTCQERRVDASRCIPRGRHSCKECQDRRLPCNWSSGGWPGLGRVPGPLGNTPNGGRPGKVRKTDHVDAAPKAPATSTEAGSTPHAKATPKPTFVSHKLGTSTSTSTSTSTHGNVKGLSTTCSSQSSLDKDSTIPMALLSSEMYLPVTTPHATQQQQSSNAATTSTTNLVTGNSGILRSSVSFKPERKHCSVTSLSDLEISLRRLREKRQNISRILSLGNTGKALRR